MRLRGVTFIVLGCAIAVPASFAQTQKASAVDQISQSLGRATLATSQQVKAPTARDRTSVSQLPSNLTERAGGNEKALESAQTSASVEAPSLAVTHRRAGSVDADEIARLLDEGSATSIDAAAAIASGAVNPSPAPAAEEERMRLPPPPGSLFSDLPGGV